jgi:D-alanyl-lipoteichoic acid acyltransferase DltB (MBOAT superfamily)
MWGLLVVCMRHAYNSDTLLFLVIGFFNVHMLNLMTYLDSSRCESNENISSNMQGFL